MDEPSHKPDPRLEIPEVLREPVRQSPIAGNHVPPGVQGIGELGKALAIGLDFLFFAIAAGVLGWLVDRWLGSAPAGLLIGLGVGFISGTIRLIKRLNADDRASSKRKP